MEEKCTCLSTQMQKIHKEATSKIEAAMQEIKWLEIEENDVAEAVEVSQQKIIASSKEIATTRQMIKKVQEILARAEQMHATETAKLTLLTTRSVHIQEQEVEKAWELEETKAHFVEMVNVAKEELKKQVVAWAEENRRTRLSSFEVILQLYTERQF